MNRLYGIIAATLLCLFVVSDAFAEGYRLKAGDILDVNVWQEPKLNRQLTVAPDGRVSFPLAGHLRAGGLSVEAFESALTEKLNTQYKTELDVTVSLVSVKEIPEPPPEPKAPEVKPPDPTFYVTGEVAKPGQFAFDRPTFLLQAIAVAGGLGPFAAGHRVQLHRKIDGRDAVFNFDYLAFIAGKEADGNIRIHHGDVIVVPEKRLFE